MGICRVAIYRSLLRWRSNNAQDHLLKMQILSNPQANRKGKKDSFNKTAETDAATLFADLLGVNERQEDQ